MSLPKAALAENYTNATPDVNYLKNTLVKIADSYNGITGNTTLNQFGDRKYEDYDFWSVQESESTHDSFIWKNIGKYVPNNYKNSISVCQQDHANKHREDVLSVVSVERN